MMIVTFPELFFLSVRQVPTETIPSEVRMRKRV
jgi:hypothetical protein